MQTNDLYCKIKFVPMRLIFLSWLLIFNCVEAQNKSIGSDTGQTGTVIKIIDGDTFDLLTKNKNTIRVRMNGIDCPEHWP